MNPNYSNFSLSNDDCDTLKIALELLMSNDIEGVSKKQKEKINAWAFSTIDKLQRKDTEFTGNHLHAMYLALLYFQSIASGIASSEDEDLDFIRDNNKYLYSIERLLKLLNDSFSAAGIEIGLF